MAQTVPRAQWTRPSDGEARRNHASFRDPSGFVFSHGGTVYRHVNAAFGEPYRALMQSGLYEELARDRLLVTHEEVALRIPGAPPALAVLEPEQIPFISYPYEWCFSALKAAALLTLQIQRRALTRGLVLRDASAFNVQFIGVEPIFIDTLSFAPYAEGRPWDAYRQFCGHFLAPLALMSMVDPACRELLRSHIDGVPLALASRLLPMATRFKPGLLMHLHLHSRSEARTRSAPENGSSEKPPAHTRAMGRSAMLGLVDSLERTVRSLELRRADTLWSTYDTHWNYSAAAKTEKARLVAQMIETVAQAETIRTIWDLGANTGEYSQLAAGTGARVIAFDGDHQVVERHFARLTRETGRLVLPLVQDLANPSPALGWNSDERRSLLARGPADLCLALALIHHLAIGGNVPLDSIADFFARVARRLIIEFVPKEDSQVQRMLALREDIFSEYSEASFVAAFERHFRIVQTAPIADTVRTLYLLERP
jgi:hypothetical protein